METFVDTKAAQRQRRAEAQQRKQERIERRRAELAGNSFEAIRDAEGRPLSEAKRALEDNFKALVRTLRSNLLEVPDDDLVQDYVPVNPNDAAAVKAQNQISYEQFKLMHPEGSSCPWYRSDKNLAAMEKYWAVNNVKVVTPNMLSRAWCKLSVHGLTETKPEPAVAEKKLTYTPLPERDGEDGYDLLTGEPTFLTSLQVERLSADEYRRFKKGLAVDPRLIFQRP